MESKRFLLFYSLASGRNHTKPIHFFTRYFRTHFHIAPQFALVLPYGLFHSRLPTKILCHACATWPTRAIILGFMTELIGLYVSSCNFCSYFSDLEAEMPIHTDLKDSHCSVFENWSVFVVAACLLTVGCVMLIFFFFRNQQSTWVLYDLMCWLSLVVRSPPARRSLLWIQSTVDWCMAPRKWGFDLKSNSTNYLDHGHHGDPAFTRKIPMVEPGIEPGTSWLVARSADH